MAQQSVTCKGCNKCRYGFTGAGVLLVSPDQNGVVTLVLVKENDRKRKGMYNDCGGSIKSPHEKLSEVASRELLEETNYTVNISSLYLQKCRYVDLGDFHKYRCYIVG